MGVKCLAHSTHNLIDSTSLPLELTSVAHSDLAGLVVQYVRASSHICIWLLEIKTVLKSSVTGMKISLVASNTPQKAFIIIMYGFLWFGATTPSSPPPPLLEQLLVLTHLLLCTLESQDLTAHISIHVVTKL